MAEYKTTIGLEIHVELATKTKIFCDCSTRFGGEPNTHTCPVCTGMPGSLPVLNKEVVEFALKAGLAANCKINRDCVFDRKNYFYPDNPQNYQISQLYVPICHDGWVEIETPESGRKKVRIHEMHMEEDAGKLIHDDEGNTLIDYNRSGVPLIEIVSEPDMESAGEVIAYMEKLRMLIQYVGASDCKLNEGSMRADVNISVRPADSDVLGTRTEMKNLNSFRAIMRAIKGEVERQTDILEAGGKVIQETRRWDDNKEMSYSMRSKEDAKDYRYFPDPDLLPVHISDEWIEEIKGALPEFREEKAQRYIADFGLPEYDAGLITESKKLADIFEETVKEGASPKEVANWLMVEVMRLCKEKEMDFQDVDFSPSGLAALIAMIEKKEINRTIAKDVFEHIFSDDVDPVKYVEENELKMSNDSGEMEAIVKQAIEESPKAVEDYRGGKEKALGAIVGKVMKMTGGKADPASVNTLIKELLK